MSKTALIVDDSKSARVVLKRMLETHELDVDTAESAEAALDYLNGNRPDVIFMDHMMPGMDGFEAVSAIKNNPDTATIPIMMYTSQQGELYVGQARALGAVGVLPKQVEPVEVSKVLQSLRVIGAEASRERAEQADAGDSGAYQADFDKLDHELRLLIQDLFDQQRAVLRRDLLDSYETIASRVAHEIKLPVTDNEKGALPEPKSNVPWRLQAVVVVFALVAMVFAWLYIARERSWFELQQVNLDLQRALQAQQDLDSSDASLLQRQLNELEISLVAAKVDTLQAIEWGANQSPNYAYNELPLGDRRLVLFEEMADQLMRSGFEGVVRVETHTGEFCLVEAGAAGLQLAAPSLPAGSCESPGLAAGTAYELASRQSVAFANFIRTANNDPNGRIRYEFVSLGNSAPLLAYPSSLDGIVAGDWNDIAASNNRIEVALLPDDR